MLVAEGLGKAYRGIWVVEDVDLHLAPGRIVGLVGGNGAGKSTIIKMLAGLVRPGTGSALLGGVATTEPRARSRLGYLPEDSPLYDELDARAHFVFFGALYGIRRAEARRRGDAVLDRLGLDEEHRRKPVGTLSKGMARKVAIARALLHDPDVLLLDEPTSGLDPITVREMGTFFTDLAAQGKAILLSAHNLPQVEEVCDEIVILHKGRLVTRGSLDELRNAWGAPTYRVRATAAFPGATAHGPVHEAVFARWADVEAAMATVRAAHGTVLEVESEPPRLETILAKVAAS